MKVTGYLLREAIKIQELRRDTAARAFDGSLKAFKDEVKEKPHDVVQAFLKAERAVAALQTAQMRYNLTVKVKLDNELITLGEAVKLVGGVARAEKMWRKAAGPKPDRYGGYMNEDEMDPTKIRAKAQITPTEATNQAAIVAKRAGALRAAIATGNTVEVDIENLDAALFE